VNGNGSNIDNHKVATALSIVHKDHSSSKLSVIVGRAKATEVCHREDEESCRKCRKEAAHVLMSFL